MSIDKAIIVEMASGHVAIIHPTLWAVTRMCRNNANFDFAAAVQELRDAGNSDAEIAQLDSDIDLVREEQKVRSQPGLTETQITAYLAYCTAGALGLSTVDEAIELIAHKDVPIDATSWRVADNIDIPSDRTYRGALKGDLSFDIVKARDIHRDRMRDARRSLLQQLDIAYQRADEAHDDNLKASIAAQKQILRDCPENPEIEAAQDVETLKSVWPSALEGVLNNA